MRTVSDVTPQRPFATRSLRIVPELRAVHIERFEQQSDSTLLYLDTNYDLGSAPLDPKIRRVTFVGALCAILRSRAEILELPEPLWMRFLPKNVGLGLAWKASGALTGRPRRLVTYAMENNELGVLLGGRRRLPQWLVGATGRLIGAYARRAVDRIAFASPSAEAAYQALPGVEHLASRAVLELPAASLGLDDVPARGAEVVFAGVLEPRKGIVPLLAAWALVEARLPGARLTLLGPGPLADTAESWALCSPGSRRYLGHVERTAVLERVAAASVVVAPSIEDGRWREQIGLPIKEALAAGATVVTTDQTGLAPWLDTHGHHVVSRAGSADRSEARFVSDLADALVAALESPLDPAEVLASLPARDGRLEADRWLHDSVAAARNETRFARRDAGETLVTVVNPLGGALDHYTRSLVATLESAGAQVEVRSCDEPSVSGRSRLQWVRTYVGLVRSARQTKRGADAEVVLVTWPVLGYLDLVILRLALGAGVVGRIVFHDPKPLAAAVGYSKFSSALARLAARRHRVVVHSEAAHAALSATTRAESAAILPLPVTLRPQGESQRGRRSIVRVLGQFKVDRDLEVLRQIAARLGDDFVLEVHGRGWPEIEGWSVNSRFVSETEFDRLMSTSAVVLIPYRHFFQSDIAVRCIELGVPFVGPRESSLADMLPDSSPLLVSSTGTNADERGRRWVTAIKSACAGDAVEFRRQTAQIEKTNVRMYRSWLDDFASA